MSRAKGCSRRCVSINTLYTNLKPQAQITVHASKTMQRAAIISNRRKKNYLCLHLIWTLNSQWQAKMICLPEILQRNQWPSKMNSVALLQGSIHKATQHLHKSILTTYRNIHEYLYMEYAFIMSM